VSACSLVSGRVDAYLSDALTADQRIAFRDHLSGCADCRRAAEAVDPTLRFARGGRVETPAADVERVWNAVRTGVSLIEAQRRVSRRPARRRSPGAAAAAALALLTLLLRPGGSVRPPATPRTAAIPASATPGPGLAPASHLASPDAPPSNATVYDWNPGAGREEPRVVWIVDRGLDI
jgi:Putative zinc-finger